MSTDHGTAQLLDAAETLFYARGYQAVGMDALRAESGLSLKRIYGLFSSKDEIAVAMLERRDDRWHEALAAGVDREIVPRARVLAVFDWLTEWLAGEGSRGCAWINAFGELGGTSPEVVAAVQRHKARFRAYLAGLVEEAGGSAPEATAIYLLAEGAMVTAGITGSPEPALQARWAADRLLAA
ncbi:TetR/AcrR family transcriptional regulator [Leucobacter sp. cx-328]|uniref:TetR/AcrR family transcriptional regulator n=1 Tax=unclassified Leucobacter TaxID=2621730 RepID=UPI00165EB3F1|nr:MULTISPECIES: TetR/AcrR family transcriptional regulator [unclassified Leucobacter]MBC9943557.1 TetR/AcrR family transcriptional regulator [Leucobacter sp. cx-328]